MKGMKVHFQRKWDFLTACKVFGRGFIGGGCKATNRRKQVTCENCKRTKLFRKVR